MLEYPNICTLSIEPALQRNKGRMGVAYRHVIQEKLQLEASSMPTRRLDILELPNALHRPVTYRHHLLLRGFNTKQELIRMYELL